MSAVIHTKGHTSEILKPTAPLLYSTSCVFATLSTIGGSLHHCQKLLAISDLMELSVACALFFPPPIVQTRVPGWALFFWPCTWSHDRPMFKTHSMHLTKSELFRFNGEECLLDPPPAVRRKQRMFLIEEYVYVSLRAQEKDTKVPRIHWSLSSVRKV